MGAAYPWTPLCSGDKLTCPPQSPHKPAKVNPRWRKSFWQVEGWVLRFDSTSENKWLLGKPAIVAGVPLREKHRGCCKVPAAPRNNPRRSPAASRQARAHRVVFALASIHVFMPLLSTEETIFRCPSWVLDNSNYPNRGQFLKEAFKLRYGNFLPPALIPADSPAFSIFIFSPTSVWIYSFIILADTYDSIHQTLNPMPGYVQLCKYASAMKKISMTTSSHTSTSTKLPASVSIRSFSSSQSMSSASKTSTSIATATPTNTSSAQADQPQNMVQFSETVLNFLELVV
ncbi:hypothetical protein DFH09DRAFT_1068595 [Mycena vulgaris]|nr:hypothetical protein DFH09DRAFT_1068595 [Mycena vulgaris]